MTQLLPNRLRRATIAVCIIAFCLGVMAYIGVSKDLLPLGAAALTAFSGIAEVVVMFYFGGSVIDSTNFTSMFKNKEKKEDDTK